MNRQVFLLSVPLFFAACTAPPAEKQKAAVQYFDLKGYITKEAGRLTEANPLVLKTVVVNAAAEQKKTKIADWPKELSVFTDADINKFAWQGMFKVTRTNHEDLYESDDEKVPVKSLAIHHLNGRVRSIRLLLKTSNLLYSSNDTLSYYPDSLYEIKKTQHIRLLNPKHYQITGKF